MTEGFTQVLPLAPESPRPRTCSKGISLVGFVVAALVLLQVIAAAGGLSAILLASATAFGVVKVLGAGYLIYLGVRTLLTTRASAEAASAPRRSLRRLFRDGVIVSATN